MSGEVVKEAMDLNPQELDTATEATILAIAADVDFSETEALRSQQAAGRAAGLPENEIPNDQQIQDQFRLDLENADSSFVQLSPVQIDFLVENYEFVAGTGYDQKKGETLLRRTKSLRRWRRLTINSMRRCSPTSSTMSSRHALSGCM